MNKQQSKLISDELKHASDTAKAVELVLVDGLTAYHAEKRIYGKPTNHVKKAADKAAEKLAFCYAVAIDASIFGEAEAISNKKLTNTDQLSKACEVGE